MLRPNLLSVLLVLELIALHISQAFERKNSRRGNGRYQRYGGLSKSEIESENPFFQWPEHWRNWVEEMKTTDDIRGSIQKALKSKAWWESWAQLPTITKDTVVQRLLPMLIDTDDLTISCSDSFRLCEADSNCRWKYWNYVSSCTNGNTMHKPVYWSDSTDDASHLRHERSTSSLRDERSKRGRKSRRRRKRNKAKHSSDVFRDFRSLKQSNRRHRRGRKHKSMKQFKFMHWWMGREWKSIYLDIPYQEIEGCSVKCLKALLLLNNSVYSPLLGNCECRASNDAVENVSNPEPKEIINAKVDLLTDARFSAKENMCVQYQQNAQACRPRLFKRNSTAIGCSESRARCESDKNCSSAQRTFLLRCSQLINGVSCSQGCLEAMEELGKQSRHFEHCICDGSEAPICLKIRSNINELCSKTKSPYEHTNSVIRTDTLSVQIPGSPAIKPLSHIITLIISHFIIAVLSSMFV